MNFFKYTVPKIILISIMLKQINGTILSSSSLFMNEGNRLLKNYQFFKYPEELPNGMVKYHMEPANAALSPTLHLKKTKAVINYLGTLLFGGFDDHRKTMPFIFNPNFGAKWQPIFQQKYGYRGEHLIEALGRGHSRKTLYNYGAI